MRRVALTSIASILTLISLAAVQDPTVYITKTGDKYHSDGCRYLKKSKIAVKLSDAKKAFKTPCSRCSPPR